MSFQELNQGDACPLPNCGGKLELHPVENCSCHIAPPCSQCVDNEPICDVCKYSTSEMYDILEPKDTTTAQQIALGIGGGK